MTLSLNSTFTLNNGVEMPAFGLGVWQTEEGIEVENAVKWAIEAGYKSIDTASIYKNEAGVGRAIKDSGAAREDIFVTSKVWNKFQGFESTLSSYDRSLDLLGMDYLDLYLVHWPVEGKFKETWRAMEKIYSEGRVKAIGVSNFLQHHLEDLIGDAQVVPAVNQIEFHPYLIQQSLQDFCKSKEILVEAWSPLMQGNVINEPVLMEIGERHGKSAAQVVLRWDIQRGVVTIPKSVKQHRIVENADIFDFELSNDEMTVINGLDNFHRFGPDPDNFDF